MKWFYNLKISAKLLIGFITVALLAGVVGFIGVTNIKSIDSRYSFLYTDFGISLSYIGEAGILFQQNRAALRDIIIDKGKDCNAYINKIKSNDNQIQEELSKFEKTIRTEQVKKEFAGCKEAINNFSSVQEEVINLALAGQEEQAVNLMRGKALPLANTVVDSINKLFQDKITVGEQRSDEYSGVTNNTVVTMIIVILVAMTTAIGLGLFISRIIGKPVKDLVEVANKIAKGDLDVSVEVKTKDEVGILSQAFDTMATNINDTMTNINSAAEQVSAGSKQVSLSSQNLSQGSTEQASSLEEITSSITEVTAQTRQNAVNANQANDLTMAVKDSAIEGNQQMKAMLKAMEEINDSSANISKIIKVIDEIAFQTNILALNAAVEAARAGQHGKGFAVVAEEVRNLAARSANAAKETTGLIEGSIKKVEAGTKIANDTAEALNKIVTGVGNATNLIADIAAASNQQASAVTQINQGIEQISQVTQSNTATAEESAAASEELSGQAELLKNMVARFKIRKNQTIGELQGVSSEVLKALEDLVAKKGATTQNHHLAMSEAAAAAHSKVKINLDDHEFGKY